MAIIEAINSEFATLVYNDEHQFVHHTFHKDIEGDDFRNVLLTGVEFLRTKNAQKWLSDDRNINRMSDEDTQWSIDVWSPTAIQAGWKFWALVVPETMAGQLAMIDFVQTYSHYGVLVRVFTELEPAREWLIEQ
ncbi:MAG: hypothetical protein GYB67_18765 [Chloroflexi bacterium]|nr:hypothetical protein [Chloroflexota bacterium]